MQWRSWSFRISYLSFSLILSVPTLHAGDGGATISVFKAVGNWAIRNVGTALAGAAVGASVYNSNNYDPYSGTFDTSATNGMPNNMTTAVTENRGVPTGVQAPSTMHTAPNSAHKGTEKEMFVEGWRNVAGQYTEKQLDDTIKSKISIIETAKADVTYRTRKGQKDAAAASLEHQKMYEESLAVLQQEKES